MISILLTPAAFHAAPTLARALQRVPGLRRRFADVTVYADATTVSSDAVVIGYGRVGDTVARGLQALGMTVTAVDHRLNLVRDATSRGLRGVYGDAVARVVLDAAHVSTARLVVIAVPDMTTARTALKLVRGLNSEATVIVRARSEADLAPLLQCRRRRHAGPRDRGRRGAAAGVPRSAGHALVTGRASGARRCSRRALSLECRVQSRSVQ